MVGGGLAFLWYNAHPAEVFMGDTGSLALGTRRRNRVYDPSGSNVDHRRRDFRDGDRLSDSSSVVIQEYGNGYSECRSTTTLN